MSQMLAYRMFDESVLYRVPKEKTVTEHLLHVHGFDIMQWKEVHGGQPKTNQDYRNDIGELR
jgi:hypothetical protein